MSRIYNYEQGRTERGGWWSRLFKGVADRMSRLWRKKTSTNKTGAYGLRRSICACCAHRLLLHYLSAGHKASYLIPKHRRPIASFPKVRPHAPNTVQTPPRSKLSLVGRIKQRLWAVGSRMVESDAKYAFKVGMATAIMAAPSFFDVTRPIFVDYWGDWALISVRQLLTLFSTPSKPELAVLFCHFAHYRSY